MLIEQVRSNRITAMKEKNVVAKNILTTLLGELETKAKNSGSDIDDPMVVQTCKKFISTNIDTLGVISVDSEAGQILRLENTILTQFIPSQLTEDELRVILIELAPANIGQAMGHLNANYNGSFDGKLASSIARELIN